MADSASDGGSPRRRTADPDLLIVGGGPAGLVTALEASRRGLKVRVIDRRRPPLDKACGEGLMPDGLACLRRLGVSLAPDDQHAFHGIRYVDDEISVDGRFPAAPGAGIRRTRLHRALLAALAETDVELCWGVRADGLLGASTSRPGIATSHGAMYAGALVGADGLRSRVRSWAGLEGRPAARQRFGVRRHFALAPWNDRVEVHWADHAEAYVTPIAPSEVGVAVLWSGRRAGFDAHLQSFPALAERLRGAETISRDLGCGPLRQRVRGLVRHRLALVGDAAGYVDAITGEGLSLAFHQAGALAETLAGGELASYPRRARALARVPEGLTHLLLAIEARPALRRRVIRALAKDPALFEAFLAVHVRHRPLRSLLPSMPRMAWRLASV